MSYIIQSHLIHQYFFSAWKFLFVRCLVLCLSFFIVAVSLYIVYIPVILLFILPWKPLSFYANSQTFSFCVKIPLFSLSNFSIKQVFLTLQRYYSLRPVFFFFLWKPLSVPYGFCLIYAPLHPMLLSFLFAWNFLSISSVKTLCFQYSYVVSSSFVSCNFILFPWKSLSFQPKGFFSPDLTRTSSAHNKIIPEKRSFFQRITGDCVLILYRTIVILDSTGNFIFPREIFS